MNQLIVAVGTDAVNVKVYTDVSYDESVQRATGGVERCEHR